MTWHLKHLAHNSITVGNINEMQRECKISVSQYVIRNDQGLPLCPSHQ